MKTLLDVHEAADYLRIKVGTIYRMTSEKRIPHFKLGKKVVFDQVVLDDWIENQLVKTGGLK